MDPPEKPEGNLRTGFTTGTSATAASMAAILSIINQKKLKLLMFYFLKNPESKLISIVVNLKRIRRVAQ